MGNKITYHSPSRGSSMEMAPPSPCSSSRNFSLPASTSMCITGATVGVGLCNGTWKAVNFQRVGLLVLSWIATIPIAGTLGVYLWVSCLMLRIFLVRKEELLVGKIKASEFSFSCIYFLAWSGVELDRGRSWDDTV